MAIAPFRWIAGLIAGGLIIAIVIVGSAPPQPAETGVGYRLDLSENTYARRAAALGQRLRLASLIDSARLANAHAPLAPLAPIRVFRDAAIPAWPRVVLDSFAWRAASAVRDSGQIGIDIEFFYDTVTWFHGLRMGPNGVRTDYILPRHAGERCGVMARIAKNATIRVQVPRMYRTAEVAQELLGPCAYYRAFGMPGRQVDQWLRNRGWSFARDGSWTLSGPPPWPAADIHGYPLDERDSYLWEMEPVGARCTLGDAESCERGVLDRLRGESNRFWDSNVPLVMWNGNILYQPYQQLLRHEYYNRRPLGSRESALLADMVRSLGRARFARFWASDEAVPVAFEKAAGEPLGRWTSRWAFDQYGPVAGRGPRVSAWTGAISVLLFVLAIFIAVRVSAHRQYA